MTTHALKVDRHLWPAVADGRKPFEVRRDDRGYHAGDVLSLNAWDPGERVYTGQRTTRRITFVLPGGQYGIEAGYVVLGLESLPDQRGPGAP